MRLAGSAAVASQSRSSELMPSSHTQHIVNFNYIRVRRIELGLTRKALATACLVSDRYLVGLEQGDNHAQMPLMTLVRLADALGVTPRELLLSDEPSAAAADDVRIEAALHHLRRQPLASEVQRALG